MNKERVFLVIIIFCILAVFSYIQNNWITITHIIFKSKDVPNEFNGFKILQISDLHNKTFGKEQKDLISLVSKSKPDIIVITGDIIDSRRYDEVPSLILSEKLVKIAPTYYVSGNHEYRAGRLLYLETELTRRNVKVLKNTSEKLFKNGDSISILGVEAPSGKGKYNDDKTTKEELEKALIGVSAEKFKILLAHRPDLIDVYSEYDIDLIFSGHAHGGQIRLPFVGGLQAPNQGIFPKFTAGIHKNKNSTLIISRGLGNSLFPQRIFNRPEVVVVTLSK